MFNKLTPFFMSQKCKFIARVSCFDTHGKLCYFSRQELPSRSVLHLFNLFENSIIPRVSLRLPSGNSVLHATLFLYDVENPTKDGSANYSFVINY